MLIIIIVSLLFRKNKQEKTSRLKKIAKKTFIAFVLSLMFGLGWIFGILGAEEKHAISICFQFLFIVIVGFQGLFIFLFYSFRSKVAQDEWKKWYYYITCRPKLYEERAKISIQRSPNRPSKQSSSKFATKPSDVTLTSSSDSGTFLHKRPISTGNSSFRNPGYLPPQSDKGSDKTNSGRNEADYSGSLIIPNFNIAQIHGNESDSDGVEFEEREMGSSAAPSDYDRDELPMTPESGYSYEINFNGEYAIYGSDSEDSSW